MKKFLICVLLFTLAFSGVMFAKGGIAVGLAATFSMPFEGDGGSPGIIGLLKLPSLPVMLGFGGTLGENTNFYIKADWWLYQGNLTGPLGIYAGVGVYTVISDNFEIGGRIPIGIYFFPLDFLEVFLEPSITVGIGNIGGEGDIVFPTVGFVGELGVRFWF
ncbi:MAG: hypothetical protein JW822_09595 [Spirochaetales bacterium]|nr:hypothetical protein [Spirochaetales bacterium]